VRILLTNELDQVPAAWPVESLTAFLFANRKPKKMLRVAKSKRRSSAISCPNYRTLQVWDSTLRRRVVSILVEQHVRHKQSFASLHAKLGKIFTLYDIKLAIMPHCSCLRCATWALPKKYELANVDLTRKQSTVVAQVWEENARLQRTTNELKPLEALHRRLCAQPERFPLLKGITLADFLVEFSTMDNKAEAI